MRDLRPETVNFLDTAPVRLVHHANLRAPREDVFRVMADPATWPRWFVSMKMAEWTSQSTQCVGSERTVRLQGLGRYDERFIVWEDGRRFALTVLQTTSGLMNALAEDYVLEDDGQGGTQWTWVMAIEPRGAASLLLPLARLGLAQVFSRSARRLERFVLARPSERRA